MESSTFKSLTSNSARNISRRLNPLKVQWRIPQYTEDMLHFHLSPMLLTFEQFVLQTLSNFRASHCSHLPTPFSLTSFLDVSLASIPLNYIWALLPEDMNTGSPWIHGLRCATQWTSLMSLSPHSLLYMALPRQQVAPAITQKHRGPHFLLPPINNLTQCPEYAQAVIKCGKIPLHNTPIFLFICVY